MRSPGGYALITHPEYIQEHDTYTCCHCNSVTVMGIEQETGLGGWCRFCAKMTCGRTSCLDCVPFERKMELQEAQGRFRRSVKWL